MLTYSYIVTHLEHVGMFDGSQTDYVRMYRRVLPLEFSAALRCAWTARLLGDAYLLLV
jgi:hypothetical protein